MIRSLANTSIKDLIDCLLLSFENYFVKMPSDLNYWENRFVAGRVDMNYSFGNFEGEKLVAFIINGIGEFRGHQVAFNTGTGVLPSHRGQKMVDKLYDFAIPKFKEIGIEKLGLEVITKNDRAIHVYERIGFKKTNRLHCFAGTLAKSGQRKYRLQEKTLKTIQDIFPEQLHDAWDNGRITMQRATPPLSAFILQKNNNLLGYCLINKKTGYIAQLELLAEKAEVFAGLFEEISRVAEKVRMNNVFDTRTALLVALKTAGLENNIDQFEMWRDC